MGVATLTRPGLDWDLWIPCLLRRRREHLRYPIRIARSMRRDCGLDCTGQSSELKVLLRTCRTIESGLTFEESKTQLKYGSSLNALWIHRAAKGMSSDLIWVIFTGMVQLIQLVEHLTHRGFSRSFNEYKLLRYNLVLHVCTGHSSSKVTEGTTCELRSGVGWTDKRRAQLD